MKFFITFLSLFMLLSFTPATVLAVVNSRVATYTSLDFTPKTKEPKPKWVKILEWAIPIFLLIAIILFFTSLGPSRGYLGGSSAIEKSDNFILCMIAFSVAVTSAMTLFVYRMIKVFKKRK